MESKIPNGGEVQTVSFETLRNETGATYNDILSLLPEVCFADGSRFVLEYLFKSSESVRINSYAKDVEAQKNLSISEKIKKRVDWRISLRKTLGVVSSEPVLAEKLDEKVTKQRNKADENTSLYEGLDNTTIIDTASREIKKILSVENESPVFFMPQELMDTPRCRELAEEYNRAKFVSFNQHATWNLDGQLSNYSTRRKVVVTIGADYEEMKNVYVRHENLMPLNFSRKNMENVLDLSEQNESRKNLEKTIISIALLTGALPAEDYTSTYSFFTLSSLLKLVIPESNKVETYYRESH